VKFFAPTLSGGFCWFTCSAAAHTLARVPFRIKDTSFSFPGRGYRFELRRQASKRSQKWFELRKKAVFLCASNTVRKLDLKAVAINQHNNEAFVTKLAARLHSLERMWKRHRTIHIF